MRLSRRAFVLVGMVLVACGPDARHGGDGGAGGDSMGPVCVDGMHQCLTSSYQVCSGGQWTTQQDCTAACDLQLGCVECIPGGNVCEDGNVHSCNDAGEIGPETEACTGSNICQNGQCTDACAAAAMSRSYTGCEYWAVDLDNAEEIGDPPPCNTSTNQGVAKSMPKVCMNGAGTLAAGGCDPPSDTCPNGYTCQAATVCVLDAQHAPFAIVVSNPQSRAVDVTVTAGNGTSFTASVPAGQVQALLPQAAPNSIPDQSIDGGGIQKKAYKVTSTLPIVAYQFNPLDNSNVFSNDASLLIPRTAFDVEYYVMSRGSVDRRAGVPANMIDRSSNPYLGYLSVVAWENGTMIEVTPKVATLPGTGQPALAAGAATTFTLDAHDVLTLQAAGTGDLTGTRIRAITTTTPFGVFGGHEANGFGEMTAPPGLFLGRGPCCADHLEDMMFPTSTWGKTFAIARSQVRIPNYADPDLIRVMAQKPSTMVTFSPAPTGSCSTLGAGAFCEVKITADTVITANEPIMVAHFLQSDIWSDALGTVLGEGDPSMAIAVPTEQYRTDYAVLVPSQYAKNFLSITAPMTGGVTVDGTAVALTAFGMYRAARVPVTAGPHKIACPGGCGVEVYGYSDAVSYMFAGGLDLKQIVIQ